MLCAKKKYAQVDDEAFTMKEIQSTQLGKRIIKCNFNLKDASFDVVANRKTNSITFELHCVV